MKTIRGAGGGGKGGSGSGRTPVTAADTMRSEAKARVLDIISEGEIEGPALEGMKWIFLDAVPVENEDGTFNFKDVRAVWNYGTLDQAFIPGFIAQESVAEVNVEVKTTLPLVRSISNLNATSARVKLYIPQLSKLSTKSGDTKPHSVSVAIDVQNNGGGFITQTFGAGTTISGKTSGPYERDFLVNLPGPGPWDIKVRRITSDANQDGEWMLEGKTYVSSITTIIDKKLSYPNRAVNGLEINAAQFSSVPTRSFLIKGIKVRVPANYDPETRVYATTGAGTNNGAWDGSWKIAWTNNPVWIMNDFLTNKRYGLGRRINQAAVNKWELYKIARYCDEMVPDGRGGLEPRYTCSLYIQQQEEAYAIVGNMASVFRGIPFWANGALTIAADMPADPVYLFTNANVKDGRFTYRGTPRRSRYTAAIVSYNDPSNHYRLAQEYVQDDEAVARYGLNTISYNAMGATSRGQAQRSGRMMIRGSLKETEIVSFITGIEGAYRRPGHIIACIDNKRAGRRQGGRIKAAAPGEVTIDKEYTFVNGVTYKLLCVLPDGRAEKVDILNAPGTTDQITHTAFSQVPNVMGIWLIEASDLVPKEYRVINVKQAGKTEYEITALEHDAGKYAWVENGVKVDDPPTTINVPVTAPTGLNVSNFVRINTTGETINVLRSHWDQFPNATEYIVEMRRGDDSWRIIGRTEANYYEVEGVVPDTYGIRITASMSGRLSRSVTSSHTVLPKSAIPADVTGFTATLKKFTVELKWDPVLEDDLDKYEVRKGTSWADSEFVAEAYTTSLSVELTTTGTHVFWIKAKDNTGNESAAAASATIMNGTTTPATLTMTVG